LAFQKKAIVTHQSSSPKANFTFGKNHHRGTALKGFLEIPSRRQGGVQWSNHCQRKKSNNKKRKEKKTPKTIGVWQVI
jgi:hypothetical protein